MHVHKTLYCFYTTKKMPHESTRSIRIYFEIFFKWTCIQVRRVLPLSAFTVSLHHLSKMSEVNSHMRRDALTVS